MAREKQRDARSLIASHLEKMRKQMDENTVGYFWTVVEATPHYDGRGVENNRPETSRKVSPDLSTPELAAQWMDRHEPDPGNTLHVQKYRVVKHVEYRNYPVEG